MPESLELGIAGQHRVLLLKGERLRRPDADVFLPAYDLERKAQVTPTRPLTSPSSAAAAS